MSDNRLPKHRFYPDIEDFGNVHSDDLLAGNYFADWSPQACLRATRPELDGFLSDIIFANPSLPVFSPQLRELLENASIGSEDLQYLPVRIIQSTGETAFGYSIVNIVTKIPALDLEQSFMVTEDADEIDPQTGKARILSVGKLALNGAQLEGHDIMRLVEYPADQLVSEKFASILRKSGATGAILTPLAVTS